MKLYAYTFMPGGMKMQNANEYGPIVQYDVKTGKKKLKARNVMAGNSDPWMSY